MKRNIWVKSMIKVVSGKSKEIEMVLVVLCSQKNGRTKF